MNNVTGFLVPPNEDEIADKMKALIIDPKLQKSLGTAANMRVINNFSFESFQKKFNKVLDELTEAN